MLYDLRATREHVGLARRQQTGPGWREAKREVVRAVELAGVEVELERQLHLVDDVGEGVEGYVHRRHERTEAVRGNARNGCSGRGVGPAPRP